MSLTKQSRLVLREFLLGTVFRVDAEDPRVVNGLRYTVPESVPDAAPETHVFQVALCPDAPTAARVRDALTWVGTLEHFNAGLTRKLDASEAARADEVRVWRETLARVAPAVEAQGIDALRAQLGA